MKHKYLLLLILFMIPIKIYALEGDVVLSCDKESIKVNEEVTCTINVNVTSGGIVSFWGDVQLSSNLELVSAKKDLGWQGDDETLEYRLYTDVAKNGNVAIGKVVFKGKTDIDSNESISITGISLGDESWNENAKSNVVKQIKLSKGTTPVEPTDDPGETPSDDPGEDIGGTGGGETLSNNANISSLTIKNHAIDFNSSQTSYSVTLNDDENSLDLSIQLEDSGATRTIIGNSNLKNGDTVIIKVKAADGTNKEYVINITKEEKQYVPAPKTAMNMSIVQTIFAIVFFAATIVMVVMINKEKKQNS